MTLVEVLVVVAMIGVMSAIGLVSYKKYVDWAQVAQTKDLVNGLSQGQETYYADTEGYLDCSTDWDTTSMYPMVPNARKHHFHDPAHTDYDCWRLLNPSVPEPTYMSFWVRADVPGSNFASLPTAMTRTPLNNAVRDMTKPWYIVIAVGDSDEDGVYSYFMTHSSAPAEIHVEGEDE